MISDTDIQKVREATDIVDLVSETVVLKQRAREFWGCCPFHDEKTPSFKVDPRSQLYHCFGCHAGGDVYGFVMRTQEMEFIDAVRYLADRANITLTETKGSPSQGKRARLLELMSVSAEYYAAQLLRTATSGAQSARSYLSSRSMGTELAKRWQLGFAPGNANLLTHLTSKGYSLDECLDANVVAKGANGRPRDRFYNRVMFPVADLQGRVIAFGGRIIADGEPKYLNTSETTLFHKRETLYAIDKAKGSITSRGAAIVVEGYTDTIAMHEAGFTNVVATLGTALTMEHIKLLNRFAKKIIYLFDGDEAGRRAAARAAELITKDITPEAGRFRVMLEVAELPPGTDPADLLAQKGAAAMQEVLDKAMSLLKYAIEQSLSNADLTTPEGRSAALRSALSVLLPIRGTFMANEYIADEIVPKLGVDYATAASLFGSLPAPRSVETRREQSSKDDSGREFSKRASGGGTFSGDTSGEYAPDDPGLGANSVDGAGEGRGADKGIYSQNGEGAAYSLADSGEGVSTGSNFVQGDLVSTGFQQELIILFIEYVEVRELLAKAFERIAWNTEELTCLAQGLLGADQEAESSELYALALSLAPAYNSVLSAGLKQNLSGNALIYARLLMNMLRETQLQNEITVTKIAYRKATTDEEKDKKFKEIAEKQSELATIRERIAEIPKDLL